MQQSHNYHPITKSTETWKAFQAAMDRVVRDTADSRAKEEAERKRLSIRQNRQWKKEH